MTGFEPAASTSRMQPLRVASENQQGLAATGVSGCSSGCSDSPENGLGDVVRGSFLCNADSFSASLAMIASLPLSDAEKVDAVRRLMAERASEKS